MVGTHLGIEKVLKLTYYWVYKCSEGFVQSELRTGSNSAIVDWYNFVREVCVCVLELDSEKIGGPGKMKSTRVNLGKGNVREAEEWMESGFWGE